MKNFKVFMFSLILMFTLSVPAIAGATEFDFDIEVNGKSSASIEVGDTVTVSLIISSSDESAYTLYNMQDYICFDADYLKCDESTISVYKASADGVPYDLFISSLIDLNTNIYDKVFVNRTNNQAYAVGAGEEIEVVTFELEAIKAGTTEITHMNVEMLTQGNSKQTVSEGDATVTISAVSTGGDETEDETTSTGTTTSGGSSSSSSSSSSDDDEYDIDIDEPSSSSVTAEFDAEATVSSGTASLEIDVDIFEAAVELALDEASSSDDISIIINIDADDDYDSFSLNLPLEVQEMILDEDIAFFIIATDNVHVYIDYEAVYTINDVASDDVQITVYPADVDDYDISAANLELLGDRPIYEFEIANDAVTISDFEDGVVTIGIPYDIASDESHEGLYLVYIDEDGDLTKVSGSYYDEDDEMVYGDVTHFSAYAIAYDESLVSELAFTDVSSSAYYYNAVLWAVANGITNGVDDTTFNPNGSCTRAEAVTFLYRAAGSPEVSGECQFTDVSSSAYYYDAVIWAVANDITNGVSDTEFAPTDLCTRAHIATFLWRAAGADEVTGTCQFTDVDAEGYYYDAVLWAVANGITNGVDDTTFAPDTNCTRAEIVTFLYRYQGE